MQDGTDKGRRAWMARTAGVVGSVAAAAWLGGCAGLLGPRVVSLSLAQLMEMVGRLFPFRNRFLQTLDVTLAAPRLRLLPQSNRIATELELAASERLLQQSWRGSVGLSHGLRYEPSDASIRLTALRLDRLDLPGAPGLMESQLARLALPLLEQLLQDVPVHRFKPEDLRVFEGLRYVPDVIRVTHSGVAITLQPQRPL